MYGIQKCFGAFIGADAGPDALAFQNLPSQKKGLLPVGFHIVTYGDIQPVFSYHTAISLRKIAVFSSQFIITPLFSKVH